jgi:hypothetical protein
MNIQAIIEFFNNKKTNIGAALLLAALVISKLSGIWEIDADWIPKIAETLEWAGGLFSGIGLTHKTVKARKDTGVVTPL